MKYSAILLSAIAASGAMAAPQRSPGGVETDTLPAPTSGGTSIVKLDDNKAERSATGINSVNEFSFAGFGDATFKTVSLTLNDVQNDKLRCKAQDKDGKTFVVKRGVNIDYTFASGEDWTFQPEDTAAAVAEVICNADFKQIQSKQQDNIFIELSVEKDSPNPVPVTLKKGELEKDVQDETEFNYVTLTLGPKVFLEDAALRCQILNGEGQNVGEPILVNRGDNKNKKTFGDGFKGAWKFTTASKVSKVVCGDKIVQPDPETPATPPETGAETPENGPTPPQGNMPSPNDRQGGAEGTRRGNWQQRYRVQN